MLYRRPEKGMVLSRMVMKSLWSRMEVIACETLRNRAGRIPAGGVHFVQKIFQIGRVGAWGDPDVVGGVRRDHRYIRFYLVNGLDACRLWGEYPSPRPGRYIERFVHWRCGTRCFGHDRSNDLTAFSASFTDSQGFAIGLATLESGLGTLSLFRYETLGGAGTLSFAQLGSSVKGNACVGFLALLSDATCAIGAPLFPGADAFIFGRETPYASTPDLPAITLVSSVTTPPAVPELSSWALFSLGVVSLAFTRRRKAITDLCSHFRREAMACLA